MLQSEEGLRRNAGEASPSQTWGTFMEKTFMEKTVVLTARKIRMFTASWILKYLWSCPLQCFAIFLCYDIATLICVKQKKLWFSTCSVSLLLFSLFTLHKSLQALYCIFLSENKWTTLSTREVVHKFLLHSPGYV